MQTTIVKWGNSQGVRHPKFLLDSVNLRDGDIVEVIAENDSIIIRKPQDKRMHKTIQERFKDFGGAYGFGEIDWGKPVGKEIW
ncbi:MAG TPA: AbrB/MazE/SpoVT family DNA-binding domain-containing protein [Clostridiales bacterium]|nr:AbrB/MazE/SpoVT family DNA-binding domain-containing protein [Clostridiales bacterium]